MKLAKFVKFREEKFGGVLFETRSEKVFTLNPTGAAVVREITSGTIEADIPERIRSRFEGDGAAIDRDVREFLTELRARALVED